MSTKSTSTPQQLRRLWKAQPALTILQVVQRADEALSLIHI